MLKKMWMWAFVGILWTGVALADTGRTIPSWVKNNAGWWADGVVDDGTYINSLQNLVSTGALRRTGPAPAGSHVPDWIKNNAGWWADGQIDDATYLRALQYLMNEEIVLIPES